MTCPSTKSDLAHYAIDVTGLAEEEVNAFVVDYLNENTCVVGVTEIGSVVYQQF